MHSSFTPRFSAPWSEPKAWNEATSAIGGTRLQNRHDAERCSTTAKRILKLYRELDDPMSALCAVTCPTCNDSCCLRASVWYDFKDLLYIHFSGQDWPPHQALSIESRHCQYLTPNGCALPRSIRPFICIWYLCPSQKQMIIRCRDRGFKGLDAHLQSLKDERRLLEAQYIDAVDPSHY